MSFVGRMTLAAFVLLLSVKSSADDLVDVLSKQVYASDSVQALYRWSTREGDLICVMSRPRNYKYGSDVEEENIQHFVIYEKSHDQLTVLYKENIVDAIVGASKEGDALVISVLGGSAMHKKIYTIHGGKVSMTFH